MSIDWTSVNWQYVLLLSGFVFIAALIANFTTFRHRLAGAILTALLFAAAFVFATYDPRAQNWDNADVKPQNVGVIKVPYDEFYMSEPDCANECRWLEKGEVGQVGQSNSFVERNRDGSSIYLVRDDGALIQLDLSHRQVLYIPRDNRRGPEFVAKITEARVRQARVDDDRPWPNGQNVSVIDVRNQDGSTRQFRMTQPGRDGKATWIERGRGENGWQTHHEFVEEARDERSIHLFDPLRGENGLKFQFDLARRQVFFIPSDVDRPPEKIYEITRVSDRSID
jgi:hypothetical protein